MAIFISIIIGYLLGSINTSILVGRIHGIDVRKHGSGNAGMTNTLRTLGKKAALIVSAGDVLKGVAACILGFSIAGETGLILSGTSAVAGHNWPLYFGFKGGKGVLTTATVIFMMDWKIGIIALIFFLMVVFLTRYVSLASILGAITVPAVSVLFCKSVEFVLTAIFLCLLVILRHYANISRLIKGTESKISLRKH